MSIQTSVDYRCVASRPILYGIFVYYNTRFKLPGQHYQYVSEVLIVLTIVNETLFKIYEYLITFDKEVGW